MSEPAKSPPSTARKKELRRRPGGITASMQRWRDAHPQEVARRQEARDHERTVRAVTAKLAKLTRREKEWGHVLAELNAHAPRACSAKGRHHLANNRRMAQLSIDRILEQKKPLAERLAELQRVTP